MHHPKFQRSSTKRNIHLLIYLTIIVIVISVSWKNPYIQNRLTKVFQNIQNQFLLRNIEVLGNDFLSKEDVLRISQLSINIPLVLATPEIIKQRLEGNGRIEKAEVRRKWPDKISIYLKESKPVAIWKNKNQIYLINSNGMIIQKIDQIDTNQYHILLGSGANESYKKIHSILYHYDLFRDIVSMSYISKRRWNLYLRSGVVIMLPESDIEKAAKIAKIIIDKKDNIRLIDLRIMSERIYIKYYEQAKK